MQGQYKANSITLHGAVAMGTGVMIGAGIFALTGQIAELAGPWFPLSFIVGAIVSALSAYSYIKMSNAWPSSGGIAMILQKCYGRGAVTAGAALLMALSMVIAESLVARTFATYVLRPFDITGGPLVPILAVAVILFAFLVNIAGNRSVGLFSLVMATLKIGGIALFGIAALWASGFSFAAASETGRDFTATGFVASVALAILAFKGFTTITNSGAEITEPNRNVGRAIMISIALCVVVYLLVAFGVGSSLTIDRIIAARDYSLAEAAEPALGQAGFLLTVLLAAVATARQRFRGVADAGDAHRHEADPAQPFRHVRSDPTPHADLHRRHRLVSGGLLRSGPHRVAGRIFLPDHGHDHPLGRVPAPAARDRRYGRCVAGGDCLRHSGARGLYCDETAKRSRHRPLRRDRDLRGVRLPADLPRSMDRNAWRWPCGAWGRWIMTSVHSAARTTCAGLHAQEGFD
jgi:hypothetical protein